MGRCILNKIKRGNIEVPIIARFYIPELSILYTFIFIPYGSGTCIQINFAFRWSQIDFVADVFPTLTTCENGINSISGLLMFYMINAGRLECPDGTLQLFHSTTK